MTGMVMGAAMGIQILWFTWPNLQGVAASLAAAALVQQFWTYRHAVSPHADMLLLMNSFGGLAAIWNDPSCHGPASFAPMMVSMLVLGLPPMVMLSRCMQQARRDGTLARMVIFDTTGMLAGMSIAHFSCEGTPGIVAHVAMLTGMSTGMIAARGVDTLYRKAQAALAAQPAALRESSGPDRRLSP